MWCVCDQEISMGIKGNGHQEAPVLVEPSAQVLEEPSTGAEG